MGKSMFYPTQTSLIVIYFPVGTEGLVGLGDITENENDQSAGGSQGFIRLLYHHL